MQGTIAQVVHQNLIQLPLYALWASSVLVDLHFLWLVLQEVSKICLAWKYVMKFQRDSLPPLISATGLLSVQRDFFARQEVFFLLNHALWGHMVINLGSAR